MKSDFVNQLTALGFAVQEPTPNQVMFQYTPEIGRNAGKEVWLGFQIGDEFPAACPPGPHFKSIGEDWINPENAIKNHNNFGSDWHYWSRPHPNWTSTNLTAREYMAHIKNLLMNL